MVKTMKKDVNLMKKDPARGYVFLFALVTMLVLSLLGLMSIRYASSSLMQADKEYTSAQALALTEAAVDMSEAHFRFLNTKLLLSIHYPNNLTLSGGVLDANMVHVPNPYNPVAKNHRIYATAQVLQAKMGGGLLSRQIVADFADQSFSIYGYFEDTGLGNNWWVSNISHFDGPFHTNGKLQISWNSSATREIFNGPVSANAASITWYSGQSAPTTDANWKKVFAGGLSSYVANDRKIPFPTDALIQKGGAWGSTTGYPDTSTTALRQANADVKVPIFNGVSPSGIYIASGFDPSTLTVLQPKIYFSVDGQGNQVVTIKHSIYDTTQSPNKWVYRTTELTMDLGNQTTAKRYKQGATVDAGTWTSTTTYPDLPNGVLFSDNSIAALEGTLADNHIENNLITNANSWTVSTDYGAAKNITISNDLVYLHKVDPTKLLTDPINLRVPYMGVVANAIALSAPKPPVWAASATRAVGDKIWPSGLLNGRYYLCTQAGKSNTDAPLSWSTTDGASVTDGTARWTPMADDMTVDGVMMGTGSNGSVASGGSIYTQAQVDGQKRGAMTINGGTIVKTAAIIGAFNGTSTTSGYDENYKYDTRMAQGPLTAFPSTDSVTFISYQVKF